jgi:hypothetical protein
VPAADQVPKWVWAATRRAVTLRPTGFVEAATLPRRYQSPTSSPAPTKWVSEKL